jgi:hypothetical protein
MTDNEIRVAISEVRGWKNIRQTAFGLFGSLPSSDLSIMSDEYLCSGPVPNYPQDLNAMHEVVMTLDRKTLAYSNYCSHLHQIVAIQNSKSNEPGIQAIDATAAQRAEAFCRTLFPERFKP